MNYKKGVWMINASLSVTARQIKDGRRLLDWSARELSQKVGVHLTTLQRIENSQEVFDKTSFIIIKKIFQVLEQSGIEFLRDGNVRRIQDP
jgi:ribosome-binding protein aMBF1 (putative translation factor)